MPSDAPVPKPVVAEATTVAGCEVCVLVKLSSVNFSVFCEKLLFKAAMSCGDVNWLADLIWPYLLTYCRLPVESVACCNAELTNWLPTYT